MTCGRLLTDLFTCWDMCLESPMTTPVYDVFIHIAQVISDNYICK